MPHVLFSGVEAMLCHSTQSGSAIESNSGLAAFLENLAFLQGGRVSAHVW